MNIENLIINITGNIVIKALLLFLILDTFLGSIRALKEHKWNSTVGIDGILRKIAMIGCIFFLSIFDKILNLNLLFMVPEKVMEFIKLERVATCEIFGLMFMLYEITSVLKNMVLCDLPVSKKMQEKVEHLLEEMTTELDNKK
ncbi:MAG: phage holin family protein [Clostridia bacterium]|nr:phage holin family protein [Clostridia bacterium]